MTNLSALNVGATLTAAQIQSIKPSTTDGGSLMDGIVYGGTLTGWDGRVGLLLASVSKGDPAFPKLVPGEYPAVRAHLSDFAFAPTPGLHCKFLICRTSAGDKVGMLVTSN
jgi:hypothetical protein